MTEWSQYISSLFPRSVDLEGENRHLVFTGVIQPFALTIYEEYIYWTDWVTGYVERVNRFTGQDHSQLYKPPGSKRMFSIHVNHPSRQPSGQYDKKCIWY